MATMRAVRVKAPGAELDSALSAPDIAREVKRILGIPAKLQIAFSVRLGYPAEARGKYLRVRREIEKFAYANPFGSAWRA